MWRARKGKMGLQDDVTAVVETARMAGTDSAEVEIKKAAGGVPKSLPKTVSAFANSGGGLIILGLDEAAGFEPVGADVTALADALATACADSVEPTVRAVIEIATVDGVPVAAAHIPPTGIGQRPCFVKTQGLHNGSYVREHDGDRHLTTYEIHLMVTGRGQPREDTAVVPDATLADLDHAEIERLVERFRQRRGPTVAKLESSEILRMLGVVPRGSDGHGVTLAGLLALGVYPQEFFPQLNVTFVSYPTVDGRPMRDGMRFLENVALDGSVPQMVAGLVDAVTRSMTRGARINGLGREDIWEYPLEVIRELGVNAVMHRDYHPLAQGTQVRVEMYPDRLVFINPGGLFGAASTRELLQGTVSSSRNVILARLLEDIEMPSSDRTVCENRGSGIRTVLAELSRAGMQPPVFRCATGMFVAEIHNLTSERTSSDNHPQASALRLPTEKPATVIRRALATGPKATAELTELTGLSRPGVARHLRALEAAGEAAPTTRRQSRSVKWALTNTSQKGQP